MIPPIPRRGGDDDEAPRVLLAFTCLVCTGVMMNVTVVIPTATLYGTTLIDSAFVIATYSVGAMIGLTLFRNVGHSYSVRSAYLLHAAFMTVGNFFYWFATERGSYGGVVVSRLVVGLEGGVMYNANVALIEFSGDNKRVQYLSMYQFFVGLGLLCGPALSSISTLVGDAAGLGGENSHALANLVMSVWGIGLAAALLIRMPGDNDKLRSLVVCSSDGDREGDDDGEDLRTAPGISLEGGMESERALGAVLLVRPEDEHDDDEERNREDLLGGGNQNDLLWKIAVGNYLRITQRIMWETGSILVMSSQFEWTLVTAGFVIGALGGAQTVAQLLYAWYNHQDVHSAVATLEILELMGIVLLFGPGEGNAASSVALFLAGSAVSYCANCLMSAPFNAILLQRAAGGGKVDQARLLLLSQYGIFFGFLTGPIIVRSVMQAAGQNRNVLASVLVAGWAIQTVLDAIVDRERPIAAKGAMLGLAAAATLAWATLSESVGGTGAGNVFSWHPILMGLAWFGFANTGQLVHGAGGRRDGLHWLSKEEQRLAHGGLMALATASAAGGYVTIFVAHALEGTSQFGFGETAGRLSHVLLGYVALVWMVVQSSSGLLKTWRLQNDGRRSLRWHGIVGRCLVLFSFVVATLGFWLHMNFEPGGGWDAPIKITLSAFALASFGIVCLKFIAPPPPIKMDASPLLSTAKGENDLAA